LVHHGVLDDAVVERKILLARRQFAVKQQIAGLDKAAVFGELIDRVAAIEQDALVAVDESDLRFAARRGRKARIVSEAPGVLVKRIDVDHVGAQRALADRQFILRAVDQDRCLGCARRAEGFCDAHLKAPPIVLKKMLTNERSKLPTVATWRTHLLRCRIYSSRFSRSATSEHA